MPVVDFLKEQHKMLSIITEQRLRKELMREFDRLTGIGFTEEAARREILKNRTYHQYTAYRGSNAELMVAKSLVQIVEELQIPCLTIRSLGKQDVLSPTLQSSAERPG